jgi:tungstate transport system ATP-binding protein
MTNVDLPIRFEEVTVRAGSVTLLDRVSLSIEAGAPSLLVGPNGSGKTTLLRAAMGLLLPAAGRITWAGLAPSPPTRRAIVFQRPTMLRRSAAANVRYALAAAGVERVRRGPRTDELLELVGLGHAGSRPARRLSAGEQQRLALARALARDPDVLFLDEPTASLDPASTKAMEDLVRRVGQGIGGQGGIKVVMSTHDLGEARRLAGDVMLLHRGRLVEAGTAAAFFDAPRSEEARKFIAGELLV